MGSKNSGIDTTTIKDLPEQLLAFVDKCSSSVNSIEIAQRLNEDHQKIIGAVKSIESHGEVSKKVSWIGY